MARKLAPKLSLKQRQQWLQRLETAAEKHDVQSRKRVDSYRIVLDTNVLVSGILYGGRPEQILVDVLRRHQLVLSDYIVEEFILYVKSVRPKVSAKWVRLLRQKLEVYCRDDRGDVGEGTRDAYDDPIIRLAACQAAMIVTGDKDLLEYEGGQVIAILSTSEYTEFLMGS